jgi:hypothetical protein
MSWLSEYVKNNLIYQLSDHSSVKIAVKYHEKIGKFYIDSKAGLLTYKPKDLNDMTRFRNKWINRVELLRERELSGDNIDKDLFLLYTDILDKEPKVSYEANINTRMKKRLWNLKKLI